MKRQRRSHGQGSVYRRADGRWVASVSFGENRAGERIRVEEYAKTKKEARDKLQTLSETAVSALQLAPQTPFSRFFDAYCVIALKPNVREVSYESILSRMRHVTAIVGSLPLNQFTPLVIQDLLIKLERKGVSRGLLVGIYGALKGALNVAANWGLLPKNPMSRMKAPTHDVDNITVLNETEIGKLLHAAMPHRHYGLFVLTICTGMRFSELAGLKWIDIDLAKRTLSVRRNAVRVKGKVVIGDLKTENGRRRIALPHFVVGALRLHRKRMLAEGYRGEYVFRNRNHGFLSIPCVRLVFRTLLKDANIKPLRFHDLRHTSVTFLLSDGIPAKAVAERHGISVTTAFNTYSHLLPGSDREAADYLGKVLDI